MKKLVVIFSLMISSVLQAAPVTGEISKISIKSNQFWLGSKVYHLNKHIPITIQGLEDVTAKLSDLAVGDIVELRYAGSSKKKRRVIEISIIPQ